ncbi:polyadenylate-binding protein-interacting protein 2B isoform X1 [Aphelocoma coerulescens]|uniref:polyadenylate-binding protein-interacting protein 2B isoform X1 n=1 Tax=Aphelocoma coerulescens TaxID=39617 RepID=UPI0036049F2F
MAPSSPARARPIPNPRRIPWGTGTRRRRRTPLPSTCGWRTRRISTGRWRRSCRSRNSWIAASRRCWRRIWEWDQQEQLGGRLGIFLPGKKKKILDSPFPSGRWIFQPQPFHEFLGARRALPTWKKTRASHHHSRRDLSGQVEEELQEQEFLDRCFQEMLEEEERDWFIPARDLPQGMAQLQQQLHGLAVPDGRGAEDILSKSTLNPDAKEFVPGVKY